MSHPAPCLLFKLIGKQLLGKQPGVEIHVLLGLHVQPQLQKVQPQCMPMQPQLGRGPFVGLKGPSFGLREPSFVQVVPCVGLKGPRFYLRRAFSSRQRTSFCRKALFLPLSAHFDVGLALTLEALASLGSRPEKTLFR